MDARCEKFNEAAKSFSTSNTGGPKLKKEIATLRKFLLKNQEQRLTDKAQNNLFDAIRTHVAHAKNIHEEHPDAITDAYELVKDALSMPFTILTTKHKKVLYKLHNELTSLCSDDDPAEQKAQGPTKDFQVIDIDASDGYLTLLCLESGETIDGSLRVDPKSEHYKIICSRIDKDEVFVTATDDKVLNVRIEE